MVGCWRNERTRTADRSKGRRRMHYTQQPIVAGDLHGPAFAEFCTGTTHRRTHRGGGGGIVIIVRCCGGGWV